MYTHIYTTKIYTYILVQGVGTVGAVTRKFLHANFRDTGSASIPNCPRALYTRIRNRMCLYICIHVYIHVRVHYKNVRSINNN